MSTVQIKYSTAELEILINSLIMTCSTQVPTEDNGLWKKPYEALLKDLKKIQKDIREKESAYEKQQEREQYGTQNPAECNVKGEATCD